MSFIDSQTHLGDSQAFTASGPTTNYLDCGVARNLGSGEPMALVFTVTTAPGGTTPTFSFALQDDSDPAFGTVVTELTASPAAANLVVGTQVVLPLPPKLNRYLRGYLTLGGTSPTISCSADIIPLSDVRESAHYAAGYTIA